MDNSVKFINTKIGSMSDVLDKQTQWLNNSNIVNLIIGCLVVYATLFSGKLWSNGMTMMKHPIVKIIFLIAIVFISKKNVSLAIIMSVVFVIIMMTNLKKTNEFMTYEEEQRNIDYPNCHCYCNNVNCSCMCNDMTNNNNNDINIIGEIIQDNQSAFDKISQQFEEHEQELEKNTIQ
jgi:hypothetical protein